MGRSGGGGGGGGRSGSGGSFSSGGGFGGSFSGGGGRSGGRSGRSGGGSPFGGGFGGSYHGGGSSGSSFFSGMLLGSLLSSNRGGGGGPSPAPGGPSNQGGNNQGAGCGRGCAQFVVLCIILVLLLAVVFAFMSFGGLSSCSSISVPSSTVEREALPSGSVNETGYYTDADGGWISSAAKLQDGMREFYEKTGVQPYLYILPNGSVTSGSTLSSMAETLYYENFTDEAHFLLVFCDNNQGSYNCGYYVGAQARSVLDDEALEIFQAYLSQNYDDYSISEEEIFSNTYSETANRIMSVTPSPWPYVAGAAAVIVVAIVVFVLVRRKQQRDKEEDEHTEKILNTPLEKFGDKDVEDLADKYKDAGDAASAAVSTNPET